MSSIAIIPARAGSKRIPSKNTREFHGKPIISYSIEAALKSNLFTKVFVLTDCEKIAEISQDYGACVPYMRSQKTSDDFAVLNDVILEFYEKSDEIFQYGCLILATAPLIGVRALSESFNILQTEGFDSIRPVVEFEYPIQKAFRMKTNCELEFFMSTSESTAFSRSQDFERAYHDAGQFYWFKHGGVLNSGRRGGYQISKMEAQDIDDLDDWKIAEIKYSYLRNDP